VAGIKLKSVDDLKLMRPACAVAGTVLDEIAAFIRPGLTTRQVDEFAAERIGRTGRRARFWAIANIRARRACR
jgi:methionyl aminopeptidase